MSREVRTYTQHQIGQWRTLGMNTVIRKDYCRQVLRAVVFDDTLGPVIVESMKRWPVINNTPGKVIYITWASSCACPGDRCIHASMDDGSMMPSALSRMVRKHMLPAMRRRYVAALKQEADK